MKVAIHSFKGRTGKTTLCANAAVLMALRDKRIGVLDCDLTAPGLHVIFGIEPPSIKYTVNDVFHGRCKIRDATIDLTEKLGLAKGELFLVPASMRPDDIIKIINEGCDPIVMSETFKAVLEAYDLDALLIDTHPGISSDILLTLVACNPIVLCTRYDEQDFRGSAVALEMIKRFGRHAEILLNMVPLELSPEDVRERVERDLNHAILEVVHFQPDVLTARSSEVFALKHSDHPFTKNMEKIVNRLLKLKETLPSLP